MRKILGGAFMLFALTLGGCNVDRTEEGVDIDADTVIIPPVDVDIGSDTVVIPDVDVDIGEEDDDTTTT